MGFLLKFLDFLLINQFDDVKTATNSHQSMLPHDQLSSDLLHCLNSLTR